MSRDITAFWHKASFNRLMQERLPQLLASRVPLAGYHFESTGPYTCRVKIVLVSASGDVEVVYDNLPQPDEEGIFESGGERRVVVPIATDENLEKAEIKCVGEQLYSYFKARLSGAPGGLPWNASLAQSWLPLNAWLDDFMHNDPSAQAIQDNNWLDRRCCLRRLCAPWKTQPYGPSHFGRVCPSL